MNLNELRKAMASDATKENEELKRQLKSLRKNMTERVVKCLRRLRLLNQIAELLVTDALL